MIYPVKVQGEGAKEEIAEAIWYLNENFPDLDVLLVGRGGGSIEDLWAFNEEITARAIAGSVIPVISCVGHEIDFTIADFVADLRAPTPSAAAELVVKNKAELKTHLKNIHSALERQIKSKINLFAEQLKGFARAPVFARPAAVFENQMQTLDYLLEKLHAAFEKEIKKQQHELALLNSKLVLLSPIAVLKEKTKFLKPQFNRLNLAFHQQLLKLQDQLKMFAGQLEALSPLAVLSRGYAIAWKLPENRILKSASQTEPNDLIRIRLHEGEIKATVQNGSNRYCQKLDGKGNGIF
jgi:exodeoxyribonuclease VII large subunit